MFRRCATWQENLEVCFQMATLTRGVNVLGLLQTRLAVAVRTGQYYFAVGRPVTSGIMTWSYIRKFKALTDLVSNWQDQPSLPELGRNVQIMKFLEIFANIYDAES